MKTVQQKTEIIEALTKQINETSGFYLADIGGLDAEATGKLRKAFYKSELTINVVKNSLLKKAMQASDKELDEMEVACKGNTALILTEVGNVPAKTIQEFRKKEKSEKPAVKGAYVEESMYFGDDKLEFLANIKSKNELIADVVALLQSPAKTVLSQLFSGRDKIGGLVKTLSER